MPRIGQSVSNKIARLSLWAAIGVVAIHVNGLRMLSPSVTEGVSSWPERLTHGVEWLIGNGLAGAAVPFFFLVSGYFLACHFGERGWYAAGLKKWLTSVAVPFALWCLIDWTLSTCLALAANARAGRPLLTAIVGPVQAFGLNIFTYPTMRSLWFLRSLMLFVVVSAMLFPVLARLKSAWAGGLFCVALGLGVKTALAIGGIDVHHEGSHWFAFAVTFQLRGFSYFLMGAWLAIHHVDVAKAWPRRMCFFFVGFMVITLAARYACVFCPPFRDWGLVYELTNASVIAGLWALASDRPLAKWWHGTSFAIYLAHLILAETLGGFVLRLLPREMELLRFGLAMACGVFGSVMVKRLADRHMSRVAGLLFGGR